MSEKKKDGRGRSKHLARTEATGILSVSIAMSSKMIYDEMAEEYNKVTFKPKGMFLEELICEAYKNKSK